MNKEIIIFIKYHSFTFDRAASSNVLKKKTYIK